MAETSTVYSGGGWTPSGTPHFSKYGSYGFYRSRTQPRPMAWAYLLASMAAVPLAMGAVGFTARSSTMSQKVASRWSGKEFAKGFAWEAVPGLGTPVNLAALASLSGRARASRIAGAVVGQAVWYSAYAYALKTGVSRITVNDQGGSDSVGSRGGSRRRRFADEYAYKF